MAEYHLPGHNFTGPGTHLRERLEGGGPRSRPVNAVDELSLEHDIFYTFAESPMDILRADLRYIQGGIGIALSPGSSFKERGEAVLVTTVIGTKVLLDLTVQPGRIGLKAFSAAKKLRGVL